MLSIENLSVDYKRRGRILEAVRDVSLTIEPGETVGLVGESGSGKSTLALAILRLIRPREGRIKAGRILFKGEDLLGFNEDRIRAVRGRDISMIFQDPFSALNPVMRVRTQMEEVFAAHHIDFREEDLRSALERVQLEPGRLLDSYPHQLSGGQRQRVMIAIALLARPQLLLADEPTTALDVLIQKDILDLLFALQKSMKMAMLFISHNLGVVAERTERLAVMANGEIVEQGSTRMLSKSASHPYVRRLWEAVPQIRRNSHA